MDESGAPKDGDRASSELAGTKPAGESTASPVRKISWILVAAAVLFGAAYFFGGLRPSSTETAGEVASVPPHGEDVGATPLDTLITPSDLPGFDTEELTNAQRLWLYHRAHREVCACECGMTVAQCRVEDPTCPESPGRAVELVQEAREAVPSGG